MKIKISILVTILSMFLFVGCSNTSDEKLNEISAKLDKIQDELDKNEEKVKELESKIEKYEKEESSTKPNYNVEDTNEEKDKEVAFTIYTLDVEDTNNVKAFKTINIEESKSIKDKLDMLCKSLKEDYFKDENIDIVVQGIDEKAIATINLVNKDAWHNHLQGSTGGIITEQTIVKTLLQKSYSGNWIKGITILIDGEVPEFDHAFSKNTFMR